MTQAERLQTDILEIFQGQPDRKFTVQEINDQIGFKGASAFKRVVKSIAQLEGEGRIQISSKGKFKLAEQKKIISGIFHANERGFGFIAVPDSDDPDIFVPKEATHTAIDGDEVTAEIVRDGDPWRNRGPEGKITQILTRNLTTIVGDFTQYSDAEAHKTGFVGYLQSREKKLNKLPVFLSEKGLHPQMGDIVLADITDYPSPERPGQMRGIAVKIIGNKNDPGVDIESQVYAHGLHIDFPQEALDQANHIPDHVTEADKTGRKDLTDQPVVTIDGDDSKDFDDAVVVWKMANGHYHLGVHIADVSYYVTEGSPLDHEAFDRGTSVYLADRVVPMIPFRLSNGICSLNPDEERLAMTCDMEIDERGKVVNSDVYPSVIKSHARMTYNNVNKILNHEDPELETKYADLVPMFELMAELHKILFDMRHRRGAIDFEDAEAQIIVDENSHPIDIVLRERGTSERMIESFMLAANETVAETWNKRHVPFLYRVHETPDEEKVKSFFEFVSAFGIKGVGSAKDVKPLMLQNVLSQVVDTPEESVVNIMLLRSMKQAHYSDELLGHFGIGAQYYTHFTSPIRRYPDLIVHRLIHDYLANGTGEKEQAHWREALPGIAEQTSIQERKAVDTERDVDDLLKAQYMEDRVGEEFNAVVSSVTSFGMFVALDNTVEGLVHISTMADDYYSYHEQSMTLIGEHTHKMYKIGQPVRVKLMRADVKQRQIDFELVLSAADQKKAAAKRPRETQSRGKRSDRRK
ncbi:ribonuclease R [Agrilactobacillus fermenti]|uniref:ribonuclease R n=1 Tax=Agrilactobacillus fermenti TaxID=2586909 RepID=UPI001E461644|nr:ribonuclease R [Agrilactobacillus fermenti]MCD2256877.1 ribonuclease R [Agrilactobacillus fermenti]